MTPLEQMTQDAAFTACKRERICNCKECVSNEIGPRWYEIALLPFFAVAFISWALLANLFGALRK